MLSSEIREVFNGKEGHALNLANCFIVLQIERSEGHSSFFLTRKEKQKLFNLAKEGVDCQDNRQICAEGAKFYKRSAAWTM